MKARRRFKKTTTFPSRVDSFAEDEREQAQRTNTALLKRLVRRAHKSDTAIDVDQGGSDSKDDKESAKFLEAHLAKISKGPA